MNHKIVLHSRPEGAASTDNFRLVEEALPELADGQVRVRNHYLSLDPYMRGRMNAGKSYAQPQPLGEAMIGGTVGVVAESRNPKFAVGDAVLGMGGWQTHSTVDATQRGVLTQIDTQHIPMQAYLGAVGMPGITAWYGLTQIGQPKAGETVVVSAAAGAVGSAVGALAKARGCRVVGIAGGADKCAYVTQELGFDACLDYKALGDAKGLSMALKEAAPSGIDIYFENVGGWVLDAVMSRMNAFGRMAVCGFIAGYNGQPTPLANPAAILVNRLKVEGFIVSEHMQLWPQAVAELSQLHINGQLRPRETVAQGIEAAPDAFLGLLAGKNLGKQLVKLV